MAMMSTNLNVAARRLLQTALVIGTMLLGAHPGRAETITLVKTGAANPNEWAVMIAEAKGFFKEAGVELQQVAAQSTSSAIQQLAAGSSNMASGGLTDPMYAIDKGAKIAILRIIAQVPPYSLWAKPSIKTFNDLRQKTIIVGGAKDITRFYFDRMVNPNGLKKGDYDLVYAGTTPARFAALSSGGVDAAILLPPFSFKAEGLGYSLVGRLSDYVKDLPFTAFAVNLEWARSHKPLLLAFLKAYRRGVEWFYDDKNRSEAIQIFIAEARTPIADAEATYNYLRSIEAFAVTGEISPQSIGSMVKVLVESGDFTDPDPKRFINPEIAELR
jgi:NitT/TauT family transport system substrate-binding protein